MALRVVNSPRWAADWQGIGQGTPEKWRISGGEAAEGRRTPADGNTVFLCGS